MFLHVALYACNLQLAWKAVVCILFPSFPPRGVFSTHPCSRGYTQPRSQLRQDTGASLQLHLLSLRAGARPCQAGQPSKSRPVPRTRERASLCLYAGPGLRVKDIIPTLAQGMPGHGRLATLHRGSCSPRQADLAGLQFPDTAHPSTWGGQDPPPAKRFQCTGGSEDSEHSYSLKSVHCFQT